MSYRKAGLFSVCFVGVVLSGGSLSLTSALAQTAPKPDAVDPIPFWWIHGEIEAGGRFFVNNPSRNGSAYLGQTSLAKYYEYSSIKPGAFSNFAISTGSNNG